MTTEAIVHDTGVTEHDTNHPAINNMAGITWLVSGRMTRWFTGRNDIVVTTLAGTNNLCMVNRNDGLPGITIMTGLAHVSRIDVSSWHTMTTCTNTIDLSVVHCHYRYPGIAVMTGLTHIRGIDMARRFTSCNTVVVTAHAGTIDLRMIHGYDRYPGGTVMAGFTNVGAIYMASRHTMTGCTGTIDLGVIYGYYRYPDC